MKSWDYELLTRAARRLVSSVLGIALGVGCSALSADDVDPSEDTSLPSRTPSDRGEEGGADGVVSADEGCAAYAAALGQKWACWPDNTISPSPSWLEQRKLRCIADLNAPFVSTTPADMAACAAALGAFSCDDYRDGNLPTACSKPGTIPGGEACALDAQCQTGYCLRTATSPTCGVCVKLPGLGKSCTATLRCEPGLACAQTETNLEYTCVAYRQKDEACSWNAPCRWSLYCKEGRCASRGPLGAACNTSSDCESRYCNATTKLCEAPVFVGVGEACDHGSRQCADGICYRVCHPLVELGEECSDTMSAASMTKQCRFPGRCVDGKCQLEPATCK
jgi:hypothetical protein